MARRIRWIARPRHVTIRARASVRKRPLTWLSAIGGILLTSNIGWGLSYDANTHALMLKPMQWGEQEKKGLAIRDQMIRDQERAKKREEFLNDVKQTVKQTIRDEC